MIDLLTLQIFSQILLAAVLGMAIGAEREHRHRSAGLRTYTLVAIGSCLFTVLSIYGFFGVEGRSYDPSRIASQIVVGIGFIGAGMIILRENKIEGLTTAAGIWSTAAIGMAVGLGLYFVAIFVTVTILGVLLALPFLKEKIYPDSDNRNSS
jgi:putative Mg2+ transporter-C (MgtC) family protein